MKTLSHMQLMATDILLKYMKFLKILKKLNLNFSFIPHLLPITKGILVTIHTNIEYSDLIFETMKKFYSNSPFVKILPKGFVAELKMVLNTNNALISLHHDQNNN